MSIDFLDWVSTAVLILCCAFSLTLKYEGWKGELGSEEPCMKEIIRCSSHLSKPLTEF